MRKQQGQTLIEVLVALATIVVVITSITFAVISALHNNEFSKNQNLATQFAQQGIEIIRSMRNTDYANFASLAATKTDYCLDSSCTSINSQLSSNVGRVNLCGVKSGKTCPNDPNVQGIFARSVSLEKNNGDCPQISNNGTLIDNIEVSVTVAWQDAKCTNNTNPYCHTVNISSCLTNINNQPEQ